MSTRRRGGETKVLNYAIKAFWKELRYSVYGLYVILIKLIFGSIYVTIY